MNILMIDLSYSIEIKPALNTMTISDLLTIIDTIINSALNIVMIVGGILGLNYIIKLRKRQFDSTFSYLTKLNVRLKYFDMTLKIYKDEIMDRFLPSRDRREISAERTLLVKETIESFSKNAKETLNFLKDEDDQMPAQEGWINCFNSFIEFLIDCEQISQDSYYKWTATNDIENIKETYYNNILNNINRLINMVNICQQKLEKDIFKK